MREGMCERGDLLEGFTCACSMQPSVYSALRLRRGTLGAAIPPSDQEVRTRPPFVALCAPTKHQLPACVRHDRMRGAASRVEGHRAGARSKRARHTNVTRGLAAQDFLGRRPMRARGDAGAPAARRPRSSSRISCITPLSCTFVHSSRAFSSAIGQHVMCCPRLPRWASCA